MRILSSQAFHMLLRHRHAVGASVMGQAVSSLTTFGITLYLVRVLDKAHFGLYGVAFALAMLIAAFFTAGIGVQFMVNVADQAKEQRGVYAMHHVVAVVLVGLALTSVLTAFSFFITEFNVAAWMAPLAPAVASAASAFVLRDFLARVAFCERRELLVLGMSVTSGTAVLLMFTGVAASGITVTVTQALYIYAVGQVAGCLQALATFRLPWHAFRTTRLRSTIADCWRGGRWTSLTRVIFTLRGQMQNIIVAPVLGVASLADINAARVLVTPALMITAPLAQVLTPRLAEQRKARTGSIPRMAIMATAGLASVSLLYSLLLLGLFPWVVPSMLGPKYAHIGWLVVTWCAATLLMAIRNGLTVTLQALKSFRGQMFANLGSAVLAAALMLVFSNWLGAVGAVTAIVAAEAALCFALIIPLRSSLMAVRNPQIERVAKAGSLTAGK